MRATSVLRAVAGVVAAPALVAYAMAAVVLPAGAVTLSYAGTSPGLATLTVTAGLALAAAGLVALAGAATLLRMGVVEVVAGMLWFAPLWLGWYHGPTVVRGVAAVAAPFWLPAAVHLLLLCPDGRIVTMAERWLVRLGYVGTAAVVTTLALFRDPYLDANCWADCEVNLLLLHPQPRLGSAVNMFGVWFAAGLATAAALLALCRVAGAESRGAAGWIPIPAGVALGVATASYAVARAQTPLEDPADAMFRAAYEIRCLAALLLAAAVLGTVAVAFSRRRALTHLAQAPDPGGLEGALRRATGDPTITAAYWLPTSQRYVDADGRTVDEPSSERGRRTTTIVRGERVLAVVSHDSSVRGLERRLGPGVRLAVENMVLRVEILAQLVDVRESRTRIVEAADRHRRALERNLHDGAQQDLAALLYRLRALTKTAPDSSLGRAAEIVEVALDELRSIAHGIYPAVLDHAGLSAALATLADTADLPVELDDRLPSRRYPALAERTAYLVVAEAIASAHDSDHVAVSAHEDGDLVVITVPALETAQHVADRVGAAGGRMVEFDGLTQVELPCGS